MNRGKVAVVVDLCIDIPVALIKQYNMYVIPQQDVCENKKYVDSEIIQLFDRIKADGYEKALVVTQSSALSEIFEEVSRLATTYSELKIEAIDTRNIGIAAGFTAIQAAKYIEEGMAFDELKESLTQSINKSKTFFYLDTLEGLEESGNMGLITTTAGVTNGFNPIISCNEAGVFYNVGKSKGRKKCIEKMLDLAVQYASIGKKYHVALYHDQAEEVVDGFEEKLMQRFPRCEMYIEEQIGQALGKCMGTGLIGIAIQLLDE